jgi:hypothetical protein
VRRLDRFFTWYGRFAPAARVAEATLSISTMARSSSRRGVARNCLHPSMTVHPRVLDKSWTQAF